MSENDPQSTPQPASTPIKRMELLAPAGDRPALDAALDAGANAVYFGLTVLNARRRAKNFNAQELPEVVQAIHAKGAKAYLTLNIDLSERELGLAARVLEVARQAQVDVVLVRDPALLALRPHFPELAFHFSTQTCMANSADVTAAEQLGLARVVLAREMALPEIAAASKVPNIETEVFCQGALCFCVSGRCLLSSWVGGRSGNRGTCTSPCRVPWNVGDEASDDTPLSMRDLMTVQRLGKLEKAGVSALKIEGRLKNAAWVSRAVGLYRQAIDDPKTDPEILLREAQQLGDYTGRLLTCGYLSGERDELTGVAQGRAAAATEEEPGKPAAATEADAVPESETMQFDLALNVEAKGIACRLECNGQTIEWTMPKTVVRRAAKAISLGQILERLEASGCEDMQLGLGQTNDPEFLMVPRGFNALVDELSSGLRRAKKSASNQIRIELTEGVREELGKREPSSRNTRRLGDEPDRVRIDAALVETLLTGVRPQELIVENLTVQLLRRVLTACGQLPIIAALPSVFFEDEIRVVQRLLEQCAERKIAVEVNSWGGWALAKKAQVRMEAGPGLPVLNTLAARVLAEWGMKSVTVSTEAERRQIEDISAGCPVPCSLTVFGRPPLMVSRVRLPEPQFEGQVMQDRRGCQMTAHRERGLWTFRPAEPFDLRNVANERIAMAHLVMDLMGSPDPVGEWYDVPKAHWTRFRFNYDRSLA